MEIPAILYQLRTSRKFSQENIAMELGVDYTTYARYENGKTELKASQAKKLAELYSITLDQFYNFGEEKPSQLQEPFSYYKTAKNKLALTVELDGTDETMERWLKVLPEMNRVLKMNFN